MKIVLEDTNCDEIEVTIRGDIASSTVQNLVALLKGNSVSSKLMVYEEDTELLTDICDIYYFEVCERKTFAVTKRGRYVCKHTLSELSSLFKVQGIAQIGKSLLVNVHHVKSLQAEFSGNYVVNLEGGTKLVASRFYMKDFRNTIMEG